MATKEIQPTYRLLGNSSLRVFPLSLGTMQFGDPKEPFRSWGVGSSFEEAEKIFLRYLQVGGNFIDTANFYHLGDSESWIGKIIKKNNLDRERLVIATKYSLPMVGGDPNASGNHKKNLHRSIRDSLARLQTDYIDILYVHFWDWSVDIEDLMRDLDEVVRSGKVLHIAASDLPAWVVSAANTYARQKGFNPFVAYQGKHSLVNRDLEQEVFPMCEKYHLGTVSWAALGQGKLTGSKTRENANEGKRAGVVMTENDFKIQDEVIAIAKELGKTPSQVALNWSLHKTTSPLLGCRTLQQLEDNLGALGFDLTPEQLQRLDAVSKDSPNLIFPNDWNGTNPSNCNWLYVPQKKFNIQL